MRIEIHVEAQAELLDAVEWYQARSRAAAIRLGVEFQHACTQIAGNPDRWPSDQDGFRQFVLPHFPYVIWYDWMENQQRVVVFAFAHGRRKPGYWRDRKRS